MKKTKAYELLKAIQYIESRREELLELERQIKLITQDPEWLKAKSYIRVAVNYGKLDETPSKKNSYRTPIFIDDEYCQY